VKINTRQITLIALFIALCMIVPIMFHSMGLGSMFLPMFLPIILSGFLIKFPYALPVGFLGPLTSSLATGMPPLFPTALLMCIEGLVAVGLISYLYHNRKVSFWLCLILGIFAERLVLVLLIFLIVPIFNLPPEKFSMALIIYSIPGIILQLILIPIILSSLWKFNLIEKNYE